MSHTYVCFLRKGNSGYFELPAFFLSYFTNGLIHLDKCLPGILNDLEVMLNKEICLHRNTNTYEG